MRPTSRATGRPIAWPSRMSSGTPPDTALVGPEACERWLEYRDNRNQAAHDYGEAFADTTLALLPGFVSDAYHLADVIEEKIQ